MSSENDKNSRNSFECNICGKSFNRKFSLIRHNRIVHENLRAYKCECGKEFGTKEQKERHFLTKHTSERPFVCEMGCSKQFSSVNARKYHHKHKHRFNNIDSSFVPHGEESNSRLARQNPVNSIPEFIMQEIERWKTSVNKPSDSSSFSVNDSDIEDFTAFLNSD